jgi:hypothetical protein
MNDSIGVRGESDAGTSIRAKRDGAEGPVHPDGIVERAVSMAWIRARTGVEGYLKAELAIFRSGFMAGIDFASVHIGAAVREGLRKAEGEKGG